MRVNNMNAPPAQGPGHIDRVSVHTACLLPGVFSKRGMSPRDDQNQRRVCPGRGGVGCAGGAS